MRLTYNNFDKLNEFLLDLDSSKEYVEKYSSRPFNIKKLKIPYNTLTVIEAYIKIKKTV